MMKKIVHKIDDLIFYLDMIICEILLFFMIASVFAQVVARLFGTNIPWVEELMLLSLVMMMLLLLPVGIRRDLHMKVEVLTSRLSLRVQFILDKIIYLILLLISISMIYYGIYLANRTYSALVVTGIPRKIIYFTIAFSGILSAVTLIRKLIHNEDFTSLENQEEI